MKSFLLFLLALRGFLAFAQVPSSCIPSARLSHSYTDDVKDLALSRIYALHSPDTAVIEIPQRWQDTVMNGVAAICNLDTALQADSIFNIYCIHTFPHGFINYSLRVKVDSTQTWTTAWRHLNTTTGYGPLDAFMSHYNFTVTAYDTISRHEDMRNIATIKTTRAINTKAFADSLALFPGVTQVTFNTIPGDGNTITYTRDTASHYVFHLGWGDCMAGCTNSKDWYYTVNDHCDVTLTAAPAYISNPSESADKYYCNLWPLSQPRVVAAQHFSVYPNPVGGVLHIAANGAVNASYSLCDAMGRCWLNGLVDATAVLQTEHLPSGLYIVTIQPETGAAVHYTVVKQ
jgi:hypothetical protein